MNGGRCEQSLAQEAPHGRRTRGKGLGCLEQRGLLRAHPVAAIDKHNALVGLHTPSARAHPGVDSSIPEELRRREYLLASFDPAHLRGDVLHEQAYVHVATVQDTAAARWVRE
jgi:hypothetical protein